MKRPFWILVTCRLLFSAGVYSASSCSSEAPAATEVRVLVEAAEARACELVLIDRDGAVTGTAFTGVEGATVREAPHTAISFAAIADAPIGEAARLTVAGPSAPELAKARCFDASGRAIERSVRVGF